MLFLNTEIMHIGDKMSEILLNVNSLSAGYGERNVIEDIDFSISRGEIVCIVGESGSGKSTLLKTICGFENVYINSGSVSFKGQQISDLNPKKRRALMGNGIGIIPQNPAGSFNPLRRFDAQFKETFLSHKMPYEESRILDIFEKVGLSGGKEILRSRPYEMSGGMNQRIAIAAAMLLEPELLLCDEATSALDVTTASAIVDLLCDYRDEKNVGILMVTHNLGIARKMADHTGIMQNGRFIEYGSRDEIFTSPKMEYTKRLIEDVPKLAGVVNG